MHPSKPSGSSGHRRGRLGRQFACGFVLVSLLAVLARTPGYVNRLARDELVLWVGAVLWVLSVPTLFWIVLRLLGSRGKGRPEAPFPSDPEA
jgi:hypothetical protein